MPHLVLCPSLAWTQYWRLETRGLPQLTLPENSLSWMELKDETYKNAFTMSLVLVISLLHFHFQPARWDPTMSERHGVRATTKSTTLPQSYNCSRTYNPWSTFRSRHESGRRASLVLRTLSFTCELNSPSTRTHQSMRKSKDEQAFIY